jgi:NADH-quinone oxidoreductase subunit A
VSNLPAYFPVVVVILLAGGLAFVMSWLAYVLGPKRKTARKLAPFECGSESVGSAHERFGVKFYVVALLFIVFDVEAVFLYPWAINFRGLGWFGLISMGIFVFTLVVGLVYVWRKGALEWSEE